MGDPQGEGGLLREKDRNPSIRFSKARVPTAYQRRKITDGMSVAERSQLVPRSSEYTVYSVHRKDEERAGYGGESKEGRGKKSLDFISTPQAVTAACKPSILPRPLDGQPHG